MHNKLGLVLYCTIFWASTLNSAQSADSPLVLQRKLATLQGQVKQLQDSQKKIQDELHELKTLLLARRGQVPVPSDLKLDLENNPTKGDKNSKVTLIEFTDYQCPFCARHFKETLPQIEKEYLLTGRLKYVIWDFPLEFLHNNALKAHEAANCAGEQGKYWEMRNRLFENQSFLTVPTFLKHGESVGLDASQFRECLDSGQQAIKIRKNVEDGRKSGVTGTPTFFLGVENTDRKSTKVMNVIVGAQPYSEFKDAIDRILDQGPNAQRTSK